MKTPAHDTAIAVVRLIAWAAFVVVAALVTAASGMRDLLAERRRTGPPPADRDKDASGCDHRR